MWNKRRVMLHSKTPQMDYKMIDFISIIKPNHWGKGTPFFGHCKIVAAYPEGGMRYRLEGCEGIDIYYNPKSYLQLKGSIMYYWQGHNFTYSHEGFIEAINYIGKMLQVDLWESIVTAFEYGAIMQVEEKPKDYIQHHKAKPTEKLDQSIIGKDKGYLTRWKDTYVDLKMYDAGRNIKLKQGMNRRDTIQAAGWNPLLNYLKWEAHYLKPEVLNHGQGVVLHNLVNPDWQDIFKEDLYLQYKRLIPMANIVEPTNKKDLSTPAIIAMVLAEVSMNDSKTLQEVRKMLYARINSFSDEVLSKTDKDSRRRQIKAILDKMQEADTSKWDLSQKLAEVLENNPDNSGSSISTDEEAAADPDPL